MSTAQTAPVLLYDEDDTMIRLALVDALEEAGFRVISAHDGDATIQLLHEQGQTLNGLITDINLGDGPDGWCVARTARELMSGLPVVYVSAVSEHEWTSHGVPNSVMITKPFVAAQVVVAISSLLIVSE